MIEPILTDDEFAGRVCIVTGAARGIGAAIAENLGRRGGIVVVADVRLDGAEERAGILTEEGLRAEADDLDLVGTEAAATDGSPVAPPDMIDLTIDLDEPDE